MKFATLLLATVAAVTVEQHQLGYPDRAPARFANGGDDLFMRSVYENYSSEGKDDDDKPTGVFTVSEAQGRALAKEVLGTHKGLKGAAFDAYMNQYWSKAWGHFDVNRTGKIPTLYAPSLMRFLMSDQYVQL